MHTATTALLALLLAGLLPAADPLGRWDFGLGSIDGEPARIGATVLAGQTAAAGDDGPLRLVCVEAPGITAILAAGSAARFLVEPAPEGGRILAIEVERGAIQVEVAPRDPFAAVLVRGAAIEARVIGTLFVVERSRRDADFVALVRGRLSVGLRAEIARALGRDRQEIELLARQGIAGDARTGLGQPQAMSARPQLALAAAVRDSVPDQVFGLSGQGTGWDIDQVAELIAGRGTLRGDARGPDLLGDRVGGTAPVPTASPTGESMGPEPADILFASMAEDLLDSIGSLGQTPQPVADQVTAGPAGGAAFTLPTPPAPPSP